MIYKIEEVLQYEQKAKISKIYSSLYHYCGDFNYYFFPPISGRFNALLPI